MKLVSSVLREGEPEVEGRCVRLKQPLGASVQLTGGRRKGVWKKINFYTVFRKKERDVEKASKTCRKENEEV